MGTEPERKFLVLADDWKKDVTREYLIAQAYLSKDPERTVRIRIREDEAFITVKGKAPEGTIDTPEFEYAIPVDDARALLKLCLPGDIIKTRHLVEHAGHTWEIDVFGGRNAGLTMAEIEFKDGETAFEKPAWLGEEVTFDRRYSNASLSENPYSEWKKNPLNKPPALKP